MDKLISKFLIVLAAAVFTSTAFAVNWIQATSSHEVDTESIQRGGGITSFWARKEAEEPADAASTYTLFYIKCATRELSIRTIVEYRLPKGQGEPVNYWDFEKPFRPIIPGSKGEAMYNFVCPSRK